MRHARSTAVALLAAAPLTLLLLFAGASCGHDFDFHLQSWLAVDAAWHHGLLVPHWEPAANYGAGEPRFVFYPPLSWLVGAVLGLVLPWGAVPAAFTGLCFGGAAAAMYAAARRLVGPARAAIAALLYAFSPYLLFTGLERTAFGELLAAVWMPLLLVALLRDPLPVLRVALLLAALWYTNAPAAVMSCYLVLLAIAWHGVRAGWRREPRAGLGFAVRAAGALALGGALAADYLLPAWAEQRWVEIGRAVGPGMRVQDSFLFGHTGEAFHDQVLRTASWIATATFAVALASGGAAWIAARRHGITGRPRSSAAADFLVGTVAIALSLQFRLSLPVWHILPELQFLQFPWRLLLPVSAAATLLVALALPHYRRRGSAVMLLCVALFAAALTSWAAHTRYQPCDEEDRVSAQLPLPAQGGFEGTDEYTPKNSDNGEIQQGLPLVRLLSAADADEGDDSSVANPAWKPAPGAVVPGTVAVLCHGPEQLCVRVAPRAPAWAVLRMERWPAWQVLRDGAPCDPALCPAREDGLFIVAAPPGRATTITVHYRTTGDVVAGRALSAAALLALGLAAWRRRRGASLPRRNPRLS